MVGEFRSCGVAVVTSEGSLRSPLPTVGADASPVKRAQAVAAAVERNVERRRVTFAQRRTELRGLLDR